MSDTQPESYDDFFSERADEEILSFFRTHSGWINKPDTNYVEYPLERAAFHLRERLVLELLELGANPNQLDECGQLALHTAIEHFASKPTASMAIIRLLLDHGADIECRGYPDFTALHRACSRGLLEVVRLLVERGANLHAVAEESRCGGMTPLEVTADDEVAAYLRTVISPADLAERKRFLDLPHIKEPWKHHDA